MNPTDEALIGASVVVSMFTQDGIPVLPVKERLDWGRLTGPTNLVSCGGVLGARGERADQLRDASGKAIPFEER